MTSACVRSGWVAANSAAHRAALGDAERPPRARSRRRPSRRARRPCAPPALAMPCTRSESPVPRLSNRISRPSPPAGGRSDASAGHSHAGLERAHPAVHEDDVQRAVADHLVGDRVAADGSPRSGSGPSRGAGRSRRAAVERRRPGAGSGPRARGSAATAPGRAARRARRGSRGRTASASAWRPER